MRKIAALGAIFSVVAASQALAAHAVRFDLACNGTQTTQGQSATPWSGELRIDLSRGEFCGYPRPCEAPLKIGRIEPDRIYFIDEEPSTLDSNGLVYFYVERATGKMSYAMVLPKYDQQMSISSSCTERPFTPFPKVRF